MTPAEAEAFAQDTCRSRGWSYIARAGKGAFKHTFKVELPAGVAAALKVYDSPTASARTQRELNGMMRCEHPNVAKLFECSTHSFGGVGRTYTVEEYVPGGSLGDRLANGATVPMPECGELLRVLGSALAHIASKNIVHRDIKPDNIMLRSGLHDPVVVDFGLVRALDLPALTPAWALRGAGTPLFAPPEQLNNERDLIDWRADQFGLGVTISIAALGRHPYMARGDAEEAVVDRVAARQGPALEWQSDVAGIGLAPLVRMVQPWPFQRYRATSDLETALGRM